MADPLAVLLDQNVPREDETLIVTLDEDFADRCWMRFGMGTCGEHS